MIKEFTATNYKAFKEATIEFKPITILVGTNSSGKSSLIQCLLMLEQSFNLESEYDSAIKLNGKYVNLGEAENIFHNKKISYPITLNLKPKESDFSEIQTLYRRVNENIQFVHEIFQRTADFIRNPTILFDIDLDVRNESRKQNRIGNYVDSIIKITEIIGFKEEIERALKNSSTSISYLEKRFREIRHNQNPRIKRTFNNNTFFKITDLLKWSEIEYLHSLEVLELMQGLKVKKTSVSYELKYSKEARIYVNKLTLFLQDKILVELKRKVMAGKITYTLDSEMVDKRYFNRDNLNDLDLQFNGLSFRAEFYNSAPNLLRRTSRPIISQKVNVSVILISLLESLVSDIEGQFESTSINYVNPLRAFPKRYYFLDDANVSTSLNSIDGDNLTEILKKNISVKRKVNKWLNKFNISVTVEDLKDIIHKLKIRHHGINLDITDVGFGISQVLPILVQGFLSEPDSLTIIEQPEIHLHPKMQADLADLFIDIVKSKLSTNSWQENERILIIETHSEYLLKRLRRRISEGKIKSEDVALYFVHQRTSQRRNAKIEKIRINSKGNFNWPSEFYATDLEDTMEFLKNQN